MEKSKQTKKPHIVVLMADQLRPDVLGKGFTPNIDSIAREGVQLSAAYCGCPLCVPSRGCFFTGTYPNENGSLINPWSPIDAKYGYVRAGIDNLYTLLEGEWDSIHSGKQHLFAAGESLQNDPETKTRWLTTEETYKQFLKDSGRRAPGGPAFRTYVPEMVEGERTRVCTYSNAHTGCYEEGVPYYFDGYFTDQAIEGLKNRDRDKPLLLSAMFLAPHPPLDVPEPWYSRVKDTDFELPENVGVWNEHQSPLQLYNLTGVVGSHYRRDEWKESWRVYLGLVSLLDDCVGRILTQLKEEGIYDDCLILFSADHGEMLGSHALFQKMCMYEESARVPMLVRFPKGDGVAPRVIGETVSHVDILPTLCEYLGVTPGHTMSGESLLPLLRGERAERPGRAYIQFDGNGARSNFQRCIVQGKDKLIVDLFKDETYFELYRLSEDPQEQINLAFDPAEAPRVRELLALLGAHMKRTGDLLALPVDAFDSFAARYEAISARK